MTIVSRSVDVTTSTDISNIPYTMGWTTAAIAVHSLQQMPVPMLLRLQADEQPPIIIDFRHGAFAWDLAMTDFPAHPFEVVVETEPTTADALPVFELPGRNLDSLLWEIGHSSFAGIPASWMRPGDRYMLSRWPTFSEHVHPLTHMRMTAMLGNMYLNASELAIAAEVDETEAQCLLNAFSLMGILHCMAELPAAPLARAIDAA